MAYGIILRIIPETGLAQSVLIDLFSSPDLKDDPDQQPLTSTDIIRLARSKALGARPASSILPVPVSDASESLEKIIFDLSFNQGYSPDAIADTLKLSRTSVLKSICTYFQDLRSS